MLISLSAADKMFRATLVAGCLGQLNVQVPCQDAAGVTGLFIEASLALSYEHNA